MFQFPTFAPCTGCLGQSVSRFGDPRVKCLRTANRGLSQLIASFVASLRLGIHHLLLVACSPYSHPNVFRGCSTTSEALRTRSWLKPDVCSLICVIY